MKGGDRQVHAPDGSRQTTNLETVTKFREQIL